MNENVNREEVHQNGNFFTEEVSDQGGTYAPLSGGGEVLESENFQSVSPGEDFDPEMFNPNEASTDVGGVLDGNPVAQKMFFVLISVAVFLFLLGLIVFIIG